ncbi:response regulator [Pseudomonas syringae]|uniref:response regulator n=1 Tax=Pseudomonas syringae TaxID=317 RepID=UPI001F1FEECF|nr:response regulator [Pseudomonas syringae]MCF5371257.1 response regulator [Pseudomonas syringae]MCF5382148.1 response regulator [Pseudomonas syringae]MCF5423519.1 response regulator [Pseudomonas syringae]MCF5455344.1 response regulator [Pseudomonas syringae]MCF5460679.1 response regulator [Pseudomonas syringae]
MKVIIIDDSRTDLYLASKVAKVYFDEVEAYGMPIEFQAALTSETLPDLLLLDAQIGDLHSGIAEVDTIRNAGTALSSVPIFIVTASTDPALHQFALDCGANAVLPKPITEEKLGALLVQFLPGLNLRG